VYVSRTEIAQGTQMLVDVLHRPWFYAGVLSTLALAVLAVQQYEHARRAGMSASFVDRKLRTGAVTPGGIDLLEAGGSAAAAAAGTGASRRRPERITFRALDFLLHTLPRAAHLHFTNRS